MAWTAPATAVAHTDLESAVFNASVRDNLNQTMPALATAPSQLFVATGLNAIAVRTPRAAFTSTTESTTSGTFVELGAGPAVTAVTGTIAYVDFAASMTNATANTIAETSVQVSGATTVAASSDWSLKMDGMEAENYFRASVAHLFTGLTPGTNTFRMMYRAGASTARFRHREISLIPL